MATTPYHHGNLRDALVEAAVDVVREGGPEALSLRELARRVGVSHAAAYRHFADREALVDVVKTLGKYWLEIVELPENGDPAGP